MNDGELNDSELNDSELNDGALGRELSALTPEPAADYWNRIDAMLAGVEAERRRGAAPLGEDSHSDDHVDTDDNVIRLTDMNQPRDLPNRFNRGGGLILAAAASLVVLLAVAGLLVLRNDSTNLDATTDDTTTESTPPPDEGTTDTTLRVDEEATDTTSTSDGSDTAAPVTATYCFYQNDTELYPGEQAVRLVVRTDGTAVAIQQDRRPDGQAFITESTGFVLDETDGTFAMNVDLDGQVYTRIWRISDNGLSTDIESFVTNGECNAVDRALEGVAMPQPVVPEPETIDAALEPGTYCWQGEDTIRGVYQLVVADGGTATAAAYGTVESDTPVISMIETGTGTFVTATEIALDVERWTPDGITADGIVYTISGDQLQPTIYPGLLAAPVDCSALDQWRLSAEGLNIAIDEELTFDPGSTGATIDGGFVRGEVAVYRVEAEQGQTMTLSLSSTEDNAAVAVYTPDGLIILDNQDGSGSSSLILPESGVYRIVVSGIRGNVSYTLDVDIQ